MTDRWVIHLPITAPDLLRARVFARTAARLLARLLPGGARCASPIDHAAPCSHRPCSPARNARPGRYRLPGG